MLAAGHSRRFGHEDKLLALLNGRPLVEHAVRAMADAAFDDVIAVTSSEAVRAHLAEFDCVTVKGTSQPQAQSLRAGVTRAAEMSADRILVALGDMPFVTPDLITEVLKCGGFHKISAASDCTRPMPPCCFPKSSFPDLLGLEGDRGAGALLRQLETSQLVIVPPNLLSDVDTLNDLQRAEDTTRGALTSNSPHRKA